MLRAYLLLIFLLFTAIVAAQTLKFGDSPDQSLNKAFIKNSGQVIDQKGFRNSEVLYLLNTPGLNVQLRSNGFSYDVYESEKKLGPAKGIAPNEIYKKLLQNSEIPSVIKKFHRMILIVPIQMWRSTS